MFPPDLATNVSRSFPDTCSRHRSWSFLARSAAFPWRHTFSAPLYSSSSDISGFPPPNTAPSAASNCPHIFSKYEPWSSRGVVRRFFTTNFLAPVCGVKLVCRGVALDGPGLGPEEPCPNAPPALESEFEKLYMLPGDLNAEDDESEGVGDNRARLFVGEGCCGRLRSSVVNCWFLDKSSEMVVCCCCGCDCDCDC